MRVLIVGINYSPEPTGIGPFTAGLAEHLAARGDEVTVLTGLPSYPGWRLMRGTPRRLLATGAPRRRDRSCAPPTTSPRRSPRSRRALYEGTFGLTGLLASLRLEPPGRDPGRGPQPVRRHPRPAHGGATRRPVRAPLPGPHGPGGPPVGHRRRRRRGARHRRGGGVGRGRRPGDRRRGGDVHPLPGLPGRPGRADPPGAQLVAPGPPQPDPGRDAPPLRLAGRPPGGPPRREHGPQAGPGAGGPGRPSRRRAGRARPVRPGRRRQPGRDRARGGRPASRRSTSCRSSRTGSTPASSARPTSCCSRSGRRSSDMSLPSKLAAYFAAGRPILAAVPLAGASAREIERSGAGLTVPAGDAGAILEALARLRADHATGLAPGRGRAALRRGAPRPCRLPRPGRRPRRRDRRPRSAPAAPIGAAA